jgi:hypothetical protein
MKQWLEFDLEEALPPMADGRLTAAVSTARMDCIKAVI